MAANVHIGMRHRIVYIPRFSQSMCTSTATIVHIERSCFLKSRSLMDSTVDTSKVLTGICRCPHSNLIEVWLCSSSQNPHNLKEVICIGEWCYRTLEGMCRSECTSTDQCENVHFHSGCPHRLFAMYTLSSTNVHFLAGCAHRHIRDVHIHLDDVHI
jgi:hypothetical protein